MDYTRVLKLPQYFRNFQRVREIVTVLVRHGLGDLVRRLDLQRFLPGHSKVYTGVGLSIDQSQELDFASRLRLVCEELGPTFIKFGQVVASRPDIFPDVLVHEFRRLQDNAKPVSPNEIRSQIEKELGQPVEQLFKVFIDSPLAAASIAQVHQATLASGQEVVVKVRRPGLIRVIETDLDILRGISVLVEESFPESSHIQLRLLVEEFSRTFKREVDFRREAQALNQYASCLKDQENLKIPQVFENLSTSAVLTEEYIVGVRIDNANALSTMQIDSSLIAKTLTQVILRSIFELRFFHADPHPGNLLVTSQGQLAMLDFGCMGRLATSRIDQIVRFLSAVASRNAERVLQVLYDQEMLPTTSNEPQLICQICEVIESYVGRSLEQLELTRLFNEIFEIVKRFNIKLPADLFLVGKSLSMLQSLAIELDPQLKPMESIHEYLRSHARNSYLNAVPNASDLYDTLIGYRRLASNLPREIISSIRKLSHDELVIQTSSKDLNEIARHQIRITNRILTTVIALSFSCLGFALQHFGTSQIDVAVAYILIIAGSAGLLRVWFAIRTSGGV